MVRAVAEQALAPSLPTARAETPTLDRRFVLLLLLFVLSGAAALVDQICFSKHLRTIVGSTAYAVSAVLAAFMVGLALGAHLGGRFAARTSRPLFAYGVLELLVAGSVLASPAAFAALTPVYVSLAQRAPESMLLVSTVRWALALIVVVVPTTAMGATLPLVSRLLGASEARSHGERARRERQLTGLYTANTVGGALGALGAAYLALPLLGLDGTLFAAAAVSAVVGAVAVAVGARPEPAAAQSHRDEVASLKAQSLAPSESELRLLLMIAFGSGALVFACEVVFTHLLALIIGNSAYAFGLILAVFLACLALGASRAARLLDRYGPRALPASLVATGAALALTLPLWDVLPAFFDGTGKVVQSFAGREALRATATATILFVPVTLMGLSFPILLARVAATRNIGRWVGRLTSINTIGAVLGSLGTGYVVLAALGSQRTLSVIAACFALMGLAALRAVWPAATSRSPVLVVAGLTLLGLALVPRWDMARLTSGSNVYFDGANEPEAILMMTEDIHGGVTSVTRAQGVHTLYTNGKFQGNDGWELHAQRFFAHYPGLFVSSFDRALVIGLGTGTTLGTLALYPFERIDVVEISPAIVQAAERYFEGPNRGALRDPRVRLQLGDGRNHLLVERARFDLIGIELTSVWFAGAANLYSREFYDLVHARLAERGIFQQWVQLHHIRRRDFATIVSTLRQRFAHVALFLGGGQGILVASSAPLMASRARLARLSERAGFADVVPGNRPLETLLSDMLLVDEGLDRFLAAVARDSGIAVQAMISTDDNLYLEYATPRGNVLPWSTRDELVAELMRYRDPRAIAAMLGP